MKILSRKKLNRMNDLDVKNYVRYYLTIEVRVYGIKMITRDAAHEDFSHKYNNNRTQNQTNPALNAIY